MHRNAPLTPEGRFRLCLLIEDGWTVASAAESMRSLAPDGAQVVATLSTGGPRRPRGPLESELRGAVRRRLRTKWSVVSSSCAATSSAGPSGPKGRRMPASRDCCTIR